MSNESVDVDLAALTEFDRASERHGTSFDKVVQALNEAQVGRESFGVMPGSESIYADYEQRVRASLESLKACAEAIRALGQLAGKSGDEYRNIDSRLEQNFGQIAGELGRG